MAKHLLEKGRRRANIISGLMKLPLSSCVRGGGELFIGEPFNILLFFKVGSTTLSRHSNFFPANKQSLCAWKQNTFGAQLVRVELPPTEHGFS